MFRRKKLVNPRLNSIYGRTNKSDGKAVEICLTGRAWEERRAECCDRAYTRCEICGDPAPEHDYCYPGTTIVQWPAGHAHHKDRRGLGGGKRNDALWNLMWLCRKHHDAAHEPAKSVPAKERA